MVFVSKINKIVNLIIKNQNTEVTKGNLLILWTGLILQSLYMAF